MSQSLCQNYVHIIFHISFTDPVKIPLESEKGTHAYLAQICNKLNSPAIAINGMSDHVHILCRLSKNLAVADLVQKLKANSSRWIKKQANVNSYLTKFSWQKGYGCFSVSPSNLEKVTQYIFNQKEHHKKLNFKEEYLLFLDKYEVDFNEKFLWE